MTYFLAMQIKGKMLRIEAFPTKEELMKKSESEKGAGPQGNKEKIKKVPENLKKKEVLAGGGLMLPVEANKKGNARTPSPHISNDAMRKPPIPIRPEKEPNKVNRPILKEKEHQPSELKKEILKKPPVYKQKPIIPENKRIIAPIFAPIPKAVTPPVFPHFPDNAADKKEVKNNGPVQSGQQIIFNPPPSSAPAKAPPSSAKGKVRVRKGAPAAQVKNNIILIRDDKHRLQEENCRQDSRRKLLESPKNSRKKIKKLMLQLCLRIYPL